MGAEDQGEESSRHSTSDEDDPVAKVEFGYVTSCVVYQITTW